VHPAAVAEPGPLFADRAYSSGGLRSASIASQDAVTNGCQVTRAGYDASYIALPHRGRLKGVKTVTWAGASPRARFWEHLAMLEGCEKTVRARNPSFGTLQGIANTPYGSRELRKMGGGMVGRIAWGHPRCQPDLSAGGLIEPESGARALRA
jgi:hypothetical protein